MIVCSFGLIACITVDSYGQDSVRIGYGGFRKILLERNELLECRELSISKDKRLRLMEMRIDVKNSQLGSFEVLRESQNRQLRTLKRMVLKKNIEIWVWRVFGVVMVYKSFTAVVN